MNHSQNVDHESVLRARAILLGSGRIGLHEEIRAYRVLAQVGPLTYLPKLVRALLMLSHLEFRDRPEIQLNLIAEALTAVRRLDASEPKRTELLIETLNDYQHQLYTLGRRAEGFAVREEMALTGRRAFKDGEVDSPVFGCGPLAAGLAEEGRHLEAAQLYGEMVEAVRSGGDPSDGRLWWPMVEWSAELDAAGLHDAAIDAFTELSAAGRAELEGGRSSLSIRVWELVRLAQLLDARARHDEARTARGDVLTLLAELAATGERKSWSNIVDWWTVLLGLSGRADEQPAPGEPAPPFGSPDGWSPDIRRAYVEGRTALEETVAVLTPLARRDPRRHLAELITVQRRLTIRSAVHQRGHHYRFMENLRPLFDEGVALARRSAGLGEDQGPDLLARALTDRSTLLVAGKQYAEAHDDFQEAAALLG
ncbi:hypothetical protein [Streptomyces sp. RKAG293]|uniref:hypothetical protein n=1 Tax=Streptomyces sp. RKAG293 TaxID=2893403 RepID=UPI002034A6E0|nr:hypothetical protein [Streptomyces sp. RKAG293]MCM2417234.1 hypothetical protein [Streptomyces sp. RKAG293]